MGSSPTLRDGVTKRRINLRRGGSAGHAGNHRVPTGDEGRQHLAVGSGEVSGSRAKHRALLRAAGLESKSQGYGLSLTLRSGREESKSKRFGLFG